MNIIWVIIGVVVIIAAFLYARSVSPEAAERAGGVGFGRAIGGGVIGIGVLLLAMPWASGTIAALDFVESSDFAILTGASYVLSICSILAGLASILHKEPSEES